MRGDEIKGWSTIKFPYHTWGVISLNDTGVTIVSGWTRRAKIELPIKSIISAIPGKYNRLSFELDTYSISYKKEGIIKKAELLLMYNTPTALSSKIKEYFESLSSRPMKENVKGM